MAEPYDVLASLNRMLESEERREQYKLQSSLALMQFAQQKRMQDIQLSGQKLELLQAANTQMIGNQAEAFLEESGLQSLYLENQEVKPEDWINEFARDLAKKKSKKGYGFKKETAQRIASAVVASSAGNHKAIMSLATDIGAHIDNVDAGIPDVSTDLQKELFNVFWTSPNSTFDEDRISEMQRTGKNQSLILKEMVDFGHGEYNISPEISFDEIYSAPEDEIEQSLFNLSNEKSGDIEEEEVKSIVTGSTLSEDSDSASKQMDDLVIEIAGQREDIKNINSQISIINSKRQSGAKITKQEEEFFSRAEEMKSLADAEMSNLSSQIEDLKEEKTKVESAKRFRKVNRIRGLPMLGHSILGANYSQLPESQK
jgi:hypothetical protein